MFYVPPATSDEVEIENNALPKKEEDSEMTNDFYMIKMSDLQEELPSQSLTSQNESVSSTSIDEKRYPIDEKVEEDEEFYSLISMPISGSLSDMSDATVIEANAEEKDSQKINQASALKLVIKMQEEKASTEIESEIVNNKLEIKSRSSTASVEIMESDLASEFGFSPSDCESDSESGSDMESESDDLETKSNQVSKTIEESDTHADLPPVDITGHDDSEPTNNGWTILDCGTALKNSMNEGSKNFAHWRPHGENCCFHYTECWNGPDVCNSSNPRANVFCCFLLTYSMMASGCRNVAKVVRRQNWNFRAV